MTQTPVENGDKRTTVTVFKALLELMILLVLGLLAYIGGQIVESERGLHAEYGAVMRTMAEQGKDVTALQKDVERLKDGQMKLEDRVNVHVDQKR